MKIDQIKNQIFHIVDGDYVPSDKWEDVISESYYSDGHESFYKDCCLTLKSDILEFDVEFEVCVRGEVIDDRGDQLNPPMIYVDILSTEVIIDHIVINGVDVNVDSDVKDYLSKLIKTII